MLVLTVRTDKPEAEVGLYDSRNQIDYVTWAAHRQLSETLHRKIQALLSAHGFDWSDIDGVVCYEGPGSFTGLRIGVSVANGLAYSLGVPIAGSTGDTWMSKGVRTLIDKKGKKTVLPAYGAEVRITQQKK